MDECTDSWTITGDFILRHCSAVACLYVPEEEVVLLPLTEIEVVLQAKTNIDNVSEHTIDDQWPGSANTNLSER